MTNVRITEGASGGKLLAFDTATASMSVGLLEDGVLRKEIDTLTERNHSIYLLPSVKMALVELGWTARELQGIVVGRGPGSYTGVRIGVTAAKTMAWALELPLVGVSSLEAMAGGAWSTWTDAPCDRVWIVPLLNARRGQAFTARFERECVAEVTGDGVKPLPFALEKPTAQVQTDGDAVSSNVFEMGWSRKLEDGVRLMDRFADELLQEIRNAEKPPAAVLFTGEPEFFAEVIEQFKHDAQVEGVSVTALAYGIQARYIWYLGAQRLAAGLVDDTHGLLPNYTQLPEAEVNLLLANAKKQH